MPRFTPGVSGNPAGRPKKLLRRVDEVLREHGVEPVAEVLKILKRLERRAAREKSAVAKAAAEGQILKVWLELLPYVHARPKELPDDGGGGEDRPNPLRDVPSADLLRLVRRPGGA